MQNTQNPVLTDYPNPPFNAFLMMRFANRAANRQILQALRSALGYYAVNLLRADQKAYADSLWENVKYYMDVCDLGVAVFEQLIKKDFNPNVSLELGYMLARCKKVLLLKERSLPRLPSDIVGHLYKEFDARDIPKTIRRAAEAWLRDIGIAKSGSEKVVVFVSHGGTCRCAMSKVVAQKALEGRALPFRIRFVSMAAKYGASGHASVRARQAIAHAFDEDLLESHRVMKRNKGIIEDADLILVMEDELLYRLPAQKTFLLSNFFGLEGGVKNPWRGDDEVYRECLAHLRSLIEPNVDRLLEALGSESSFGGSKIRSLRQQSGIKPKRL
jgi:protein-tyrosine-phosphatase